MFMYVYKATHPDGQSFYDYVLAKSDCDAQRRAEAIVAGIDGLDWPLTIEADILLIAPLASDPSCVVEELKELEELA